MQYLLMKAPQFVLYILYSVTKAVILNLWGRIAKILSIFLIALTKN